MALMMKPIPTTFILLFPLLLVLAFSLAAEDAEAISAKDFVEDKIAKQKVVIFSKASCPYCQQAKQALEKLIKSKEIHVVELGSGARLPPGLTAYEVQAYLGEKTGARTVPRVFVGGEFVGGGSDTEAQRKSGELRQKLESAGVKLRN